MNINFSDMSGLLSEYSSVRSGSYKKLLTAYYSKVAGSKEGTQEKISNKVSTKDKTIDKVEKNTLKSISSNSDSLALSASKLTDKSGKSVFTKNEVETVNKDTGEKTVSYEYDKEKISSAVSQFVSDYNSVIDKAGDTDSTKVMSKTLSMINSTKAYKESLSKIGISIGEDNKLTVDKEKFEAANMTSVKSLFNDSNSFGERTMQKALQIGGQADKEQLSIYTNKASYENYDFKSLLNIYL